MCILCIDPLDLQILIYITEWVTQMYITAHVMKIAIINSNNIMSNATIDLSPFTVSLSEVLGINVGQC